MRQIAVAGNFDDMRSTEVRFLQEAARLGQLKVLLRSDESILAATGKNPKFPYAERNYFLQALRYVDTVSQTDLTDPDTISVKGWTPDTWVVREKDANSGKMAFCNVHAIEYRILKQESLKGFPLPLPDSGAKTSVKKVVVTGCYDWFHSGHVRFFEEVSAHGDVYVVVGHDANIRFLKGEGHPLLPEAERRYVAGSVRFVKQALVSTGEGWMDAAPEIARLKPDIYAVNEDGDRPEKRAFCEQHGLRYLVLKRTPAPGLPRRTSTNLRGF